MPRIRRRVPFQRVQDRQGNTREDGPDVRRLQRWSCLDRVLEGCYHDFQGQESRVWN